jgi:hypothetical protein
VVVVVIIINLIMPMDNLCCDNIDDVASSDGSVTHTPTDAGILECDYATHCTRLYKLIEQKQWEEVVHYLETGKFFDTALLSSIFGEDPDDPSVATRTWVTAVDKKGHVRWCQLPLHAAVTFKAPFKVIDTLVRVYPKSVRCADDQDMLPLHYAFRFGAEDDVVIYLIDKFPQATGKKAVKGRLPLDMAQYGSKADRGLIIEYYVDRAIQRAKAEWDREYGKIVSGMKTENIEPTLVNELTSKRHELMECQRELAMAKKEIERLNVEVSVTEQVLLGDDVNLAHNRSLRSSRTTKQSDSTPWSAASNKKRISNNDNISTAKSSTNSTSSNKKTSIGTATAPSMKSTVSSKDPRSSRGSADEDGVGKHKGFGQIFGKRRK